MSTNVVFVERGDNGLGAYGPDLPGCVAVGETRDEATRLIQEAIELHTWGHPRRGSAAA